MFRSTRLRAVEASICLNVPSHVKARSVPVPDQLKQAGIKSADIENSKGGAGICARAASSLLQDWVMLAHRRPIHSTNADPTSNLNTRSWSDEECVMISKTIQLREFDQTKMIKMNLSSSSTHQSSTPRVVSRTSSSMTCVGGRCWRTEDFFVNYVENKNSRKKSGFKFLNKKNNILLQ